MKIIPVIACASSRLQADMMLIRLRRVGISCRKVAALFQRRRIPNSVACWLKIQDETPKRPAAEAVTLAGDISRQLERVKWDARAVTDLLTDIGLDAGNARSFWERLSEGKIVLVVSAAHETEASIAWHVFKHVSAEQIAMGATPVGRVLSAPRYGEMSAGFDRVSGNDSAIWFRNNEPWEADGPEMFFQDAVR